MKKLFSTIILMFLLVLVGCTNSNNELPDLKNDDKVEMTSEQKLTFLQSVMNLGEATSKNFRLDTFINAEYAVTSNLEYESVNTMMQSNMTQSVSIDFDATNYIEVGESHLDTYMYAKLNKLDLNVLSAENSTTTIYNDATTNNNTYTLDFSLTDSFFLTKSDYAYYYLNGSRNVEVKENNVVLEDESSNKNYVEIKEKSLENRITELIYQEIIQKLDEFQSMLEVDINLEMTPDERTKALEALDNYVSIYSEGTTHTVRFLITTQMVSDLIDQTFDMLILELEDGLTLEKATALKTTIKQAIKSFDFDFRIVLKGELEGQKQISQIMLMVKGDFSGFTLDMKDFDEMSLPVVLNVTVKLNKLGFILDYDADKLTLPTAEELNDFTEVEKAIISEDMDFGF
ncbi:hypothetical protein [Acholeplasma granularum]|uniref:hypothetical protein n=1 Tax=Acholeplasma granularum TaxID=264635 RepID=UPI00047268E2|nr:hypothetical protein [Acholeplasma granularum]